MANTDFISSCFNGYLPVTDACFQFLIVCYCYCFDYLRILGISHYETAIPLLLPENAKLNSRMLVICLYIFVYPPTA